MADYEYTINIRNVSQDGSNDKGVQGGTNISGNVGAPTDINSKSVTNDKKASVEDSGVKGIAIAQAKKYALYAVSVGTELSGDSRLQSNVNNAIEALALGALAYKHPAIAALAAVYNVVTTVTKETVRAVKEKTAIEQQRARAGLSTYEEITTSRRH